MKDFLLPLLWSVVLIGCQDKENSVASHPQETKRTEESKPYKQIKRKVENNIASIGISTYRLITKDLARDSAEADALMRAKILIPLAMQKHDAALFKSTIAKGFTAHGENEFFGDKEAFIQNRVNGKWMISDVEYEKLVLQFFSDFGLLTYRNTVKEIDEKGVPQTWHFTWADIWVKEDGKWKVKSGRGIHPMDN